MKPDFSLVKTPSYVVDEQSLKYNLSVLRSVMDRTGCEILLAQKAFSMYAVYPMIGNSLSGTTASSLFEARLGYEEMGKEVHIFAPAYKEEEFDEVLSLCDHIVFNSLQQWNKYKEKVFRYNSEQEALPSKAIRKVSCGLRINPEYSEIETDLYNPCFENSRFGVTLKKLQGADLTGLE